VHVLGALEKDHDRFQRLLQPFRAMIDVQIACAERLRGARTRYKKANKIRIPTIPTVLSERASDLVCVVGEANAWPYHAADRAIYPDVLVHWTAKRLATGETFDFVATPTTPLAPNTLLHTRLSADDLAQAGTLPDLLDAWRSFLRPTDVLCSWGRYATALFVTSGGHLPAERIDLRQVARRLKEGKVGTLEGFAASVGIGSSASVARGRAGVRLAQVEDITRHFQAVSDGGSSKTSSRD
jgi:hypothetical protein